VLLLCTDSLDSDDADERAQGGDDDGGAHGWRIERLMGLVDGTVSGGWGGSVGLFLLFVAARLSRWRDHGAEWMTEG